MIGLLNAVRINVGERILTAAAAIVLSAVFAALVMASGIPTLRQDWTWPVAAAQVHRFLIDTWSGWSVVGIGAPAPYPSSYLIGVPLYVLLVLLGSKAALYTFLLGIGLMVTLGARALLDRFGAGIASVGVLAFALFNPWVYTKIVAGHTLMVLAYGATFFLIALLLDSRPAWKPLLAALAAIFAQLQFFVIAMALLLTRFKQWGARIAWLLGIVLFLPSLAGVAANWSALSKIPYTLTWQQSQSVAPGDAVFLVGYFAGYANNIDLLARLSTGFAIAGAIVGLIAAWRRSRREQLQVCALAALGIIALIAATGTKGPTAGLYSYVVQTIPASGLFRELYDLLGYLAIVYVALCAFGSRSAVTSALCAMAGGLAILSWFAAPPSAFFVPRSAIPDVSFTAQPNTRYALYPPFQPMSFQGRGSGLDPNAYNRAHNVTPMNTYISLYPESVALLRFQSSGSPRMLHNLSVATIIERPWLHSSVESLRDTLGTVSPSVKRGVQGDRAIAALPELALTAPPQIAAVADDLGASNVFFADARSAKLGNWRDLPHFEPVQAPNATIDAKNAWVDARLTFLARPNAAQAFGGVATWSKQLLPVTRGRSLLVYARGTLRTGNAKLLASNTGSYIWTAPLPADANAVRCSGFCVVAGSAEAVPHFPVNPSSGGYTPVQFHAILPWLATATLPPTATWKTLRYNVRYNHAWTAYAGGRRIQHVPLDHLLNGWLLPPSSARSRPLVLIDTVAALQTGFELIGALLVLGVFIAMAADRVRGRREPA